MARIRTKPADDTLGDAGAPIEQCLIVQDEIWRIVLEAARTESRLSLAQQAKRIADAFPASGLTHESISDALVFAAIDAGVMIEIRKPVTRQAPTIDVPGIFAFVGRGRKARGGQRARPTFAGVPIPATT